MTDTARLTLPLIAPEQAQKHVTHNEALLLLDAIVQLRLAGLGETEPPEAPEPGEAFALGAGAIDGWEGHDGDIAAWTAGGWRFATPQEGWIAWDDIAARVLVYREGDWAPLLHHLDGLGVGAAPDAVNRLAVRSEAALFAAIEAGSGGNGDVRLTLNKETAGDSATLIFQSGWSGRAEIGLAGNDDFAFKVSADGVGFTTAMVLDAAEGFVRFERLFGGVPGEPVIDAGVLAVQTSVVAPQPETGASDEVVSISGGFDGALLVVVGSAGVTLTFRDGLGNLRLGADRVLDAAEDTLTLLRRGGEWVELAYADNG